MTRLLVSGDGLGEEDGDPDDDGDFDEGSEFDDKGTAGQAKPSRGPLPPWLLEPFKARVAESSNQYRDAAGLPPLYAQHQTFWFPQPSTYFLIKKSSTPQQLFNPLFFLWDPEALCPDGIPCPNCRRVLHSHQAISQPHRCVGIDQTFWIIGYRYRCRNCVHSAAGSSKTHFIFLICFISLQLTPSDFSLQGSFATQYSFLIKLTNHASIVGVNSRIPPQTYNMLQNSSPQWI